MAQQKQKQVQIQFKLVDVRQVQFVTLCNEWPEGEMQIGNQINFNSDTEKRIVRCLLNVEFKKNDITQMIVSVESVYEFSRESWSALYNLNEDGWILPLGLVHHIADVTLGATRGILSARCDDAGFPRALLPLMNPADNIRNDLHIKRQVAQPNAESADSQDMPTPKAEA